MSFQTPRHPNTRTPHARAPLTWWRYQTSSFASWSISRADVYLRATLYYPASCSQSPIQFELRYITHPFFMSCAQTPIVHSALHAYTYCIPTDTYDVFHKCDVYFPFKSVSINENTWKSIWNAHAVEVIIRTSNNSHMLALLIGIGSL